MGVEIELLDSEEWWTFRGSHSDGPCSRLGVLPNKVWLHPPAHLAVALTCGEGRKARRNLVSIRKSDCCRVMVTLPLRCKMRVNARAI
jgi:hypothetical protein